MKMLIIVIILMLCVACFGESKPPVFSYVANFKSNQISEVESFIKTFANNKGFAVFEKDKKSMKGLTKGQDAFFIGVYDEKLSGFFRKRYFFLTITNVGVADKLRVMLYNVDGLDKENVETIKDEIISGLRQLNIELLAHHIQ